MSSSNSIPFFPALGLTIFLFLASLLSLVQSDATLVDQTCRKTPFYALCMSTLKSDPGSSRADVPGLGLIMVKAVKSKSIQTLKRIEQLLRRGAQPKQALTDCADMYDAIIKGDVPQAVEALQKGNPKFAVNGMNDAANEANTCEDGFHGKSPITNLNKVVHDLSVIASVISQQLL